MTCDRYRRVLLTGASGFVGSGVLRYLLEQTDWTFVCPCSWRHYGNPLHVPRDARVQVITCDLARPLPDMGNFDVILNLAADSHVDRSIADPVSFVENNVSVVLHVLEYARTQSAPLSAFIQFSTDEVYGATAHSEWDVLLPSNPYAASKAAQEMIAIAYWRTYNLPVVLTNSNNIVGPGQNKEKFVPKVIDLVDNGDVVSIHTTEHGPGRRVYNPVQNVASALIFIIARGCTRYQSGIDRPDRYPLGGGEELDNLEMAEMIAALRHKPLHYELVPAESVRPGYDEFYPRTDGQLADLGWRPPVTLQEALSVWLESP